MRHYKEIILHGASIFNDFRQLRDSHGSEAAVSITAVRSGARALSELVATTELGEDDFFGSIALGSEVGDDVWIEGEWDESWDEGWGEWDEGWDEPADNEFLSAFGGDDKLLEQCGIDADRMMNKAIGAYFLYGSGLGFDSFDLSSPNQLASINIADVAPMILALKDDDEEDCTAADTTKLVIASKNYLECSGLSSAMLDFNSNLVQDIEDSCKPAFNSFLSLEGDVPDADDLDENSELGQGVRQCMEYLLGDNLIGNLIRYEYQNLDKILGCAKSHSEEVPRCVMKIQTPNATVLFPLSLQKKMFCLIGAASDDMVEDMCIELYVDLDYCLPEAGDTTDEDVCRDHFLGLDSSIITNDKLPGYCSEVYEKQGVDDTGLQSRFDEYNAYREHGWTIDIESSPSTDQGAEIPVVVQAASFESVEHAQLRG